LVHVAKEFGLKEPKTAVNCAQSTLKN